MMFNKATRTFHVSVPKEDWMMAAAEKAAEIPVMRNDVQVGIAYNFQVDGESMTYDVSTDDQQTIDAALSNEFWNAAEKVQSEEFIKALNRGNHRTAIAACQAAIQYDAAIQRAAVQGEQWIGGDLLDTLYERWISLARKALGIKADEKN